MVYKNLYLKIIKIGQAVKLFSNIIPFANLKVRRFTSTNARLIKFENYLHQLIIYTYSGHVSDSLGKTKQNR